MNETEKLLEQLRDVEVPQVSASLALGWWLLLLLLLGLCYLAYVKYKSWGTKLWQRQAEQEMQAIRDSSGHQPSVTTLASCSQLARKVVLVVDDREQIASLHGEPWLEKLDEVCRKPEFTQGIGRLLLDQAYQKQPNIAQHDLNELFESMDVLIESAGSYKIVQSASEPQDARR